jgi:hypothetical protein
MLAEPDNRFRPGRAFEGGAIATGWLGPELSERARRP